MPPPRKGAVEEITRVLARDSVTATSRVINAVALELERPGSAAEVTNVVAFLVGAAGHRVNCQVVRADGLV